MAFEGTIVLFVEGEPAPHPRMAEPLATIWARHLIDASELKSIRRIIPISKKEIVRMHPGAPLSGVGTVALDERIRVELRREPFDVMQPDFESLLLRCESTIRRALGVKIGARADWPEWDRNHPRPGDLLQASIKAAQRVKPVPRAVKQVYGDMETAKNAWGEYLLRVLVQDPKCLAALRAHPIAMRISEVINRDR